MTEFECKVISERERTERRRERETEGRMMLGLTQSTYTAPEGSGHLGWP